MTLCERNLLGYYTADRMNLQFCTHRAFGGRSAAGGYAENRIGVQYKMLDENYMSDVKKYCAKY